MSPRAVMVVALALALFVARGDRVAHAATDQATPSTTHAAGTPDAAAELSTLLGPQRRVRDFAPFTTERGEPAFLVLFVTEASEPVHEIDLSQAHSCSDDVGGIGLSGTYHVGLGRALVNEVT